MSTVKDTSTENKINIVRNTKSNVTVTQPSIQTVEILTGPLGPSGTNGTPGTQGPAGPSGSLTISSSLGPITIDGNLTLSGSITISGSGDVITSEDTGSFITNSQTGSFLTGNDTGSFVINSQTGSFITNSQTGSFLTGNDTGSFVINSQTGSFITNSQTSSMTVLSSSFATTASFISSTFISSSAAASGFGSGGGGGSSIDTGSLGSTTITGSLNISGSITTFNINMSTWTLGADGGSNYYYFTGPGDLGGTEQNPDIHLTRGQKYRFYNPLNAHPFQIQDTGGSAFSTGVTNNGVQLGFLSFDVPMDGPTHLLYQCTSHAAMKGNIYIADARIASGSFSGSFQGTIFANNLILDYDSLPTSDPSTKGQIYRNGSNQLLISAG